MKNVFLSYSRSDTELAFSLAAEIELLGYSIWIDREIEGGQNWWAEIISAIRNCDVFVFCASGDSLTSEICRTEFDYAVALRKVILPISLAEMEVVHPMLADRHVISFLSADYGHRKEVAKALLGIPPPHPAPIPEPDPPQLPAMPLVEISRRLRMAVLTLEEQEDILRSLNELLTKRTRVNEVKVLASEFRQHASVALRVASELDRILEISPACISKERMKLSVDWSITLDTQASSIIGRDKGAALIVLCKEGRLLELETDRGRKIRSVDFNISVNDMDVSEKAGIIAIAGSKEIVLRSVLGTRDPFGNTYDHTIGIGRVNGLDSTTQGYDVNIAEEEDAGTGKDPEEYRDKAVIFSIAGPTGQLVNEIPPFRVVSLDNASERVAFGLDNGTVLIWCLRWHELICRIALPDADSVRALRFIDGDLFVGDYEGHLYKIDSESKVVALAQQQKGAICAIIEDDGFGNLVTLTVNGQISRYRRNDLAELETSRLEVHCVVSVVCGPLGISLTA
ncbi:MAG: toll/interleukin-1 receptor domain-containing protein [Sphingomonadales bacterium]|nr:MAG: toll/interleukin-1 receptor domain-containing protein [Sphingomonadales bacterium]